VDYQALLDRRAAVAAEITKVIDTLGALAAEERDLQDRLRRLGPVCTWPSMHIAAKMATQPGGGILMHNFSAVPKLSGF
jgi:hypothetical protein